MGHNTDFSKVPFPGLLNDINTVGVETTYTSPTGSVGRFQGFLGAIIRLDNYDASLMSDTTIGTLYHGRYQLVQLLSTGGAGVRGYAAFWPAASLKASAQASRYIVTATATDGDQAGTFICAVTAGDYCWIQLDGLCTVQYRATVTALTPAVKDLIYMTSGAATYDDPTQSTTQTPATVKLLVGVAEVVPAVSTALSPANYILAGSGLNLVEVFPRITNW